MTNKNNPNVKMVTGNVKRINIGFTKKLSKPRTIATVNAVVNSSTNTPFIRYAKIITNTAVINILRSNFIIVSFSFIKLVRFFQKCTVSSKNSCQFLACS